MSKCPYCQASERQVKNGWNSSGSQRMRCQICKRNHTPEPKPNGYEESVRTQALRMVSEGMSLRAVGRVLGVSPQSVANWLRAHAAQLPDAPSVSSPDVVEMDEMFIFIGQKKPLLPRPDG